METQVITLDSVSKKFRLFPNKKSRMLYALNPLKSKHTDDFFALQDINLTVEKGELLGIIGRNGSGKSTLLKIISGILSPTTGTVETTGKIVPLLELGAGFHPEFTGLENIYFYTVVLGYDREHIKRLIPEIVEFSELGDFIKQPIKNYSSGMKSRLAFSVSILIEPDILILDEVLAVGDEYFREKSFERMNRFFRSGKTILFVSHSADQIKKLCKRVVLLDKGRILDEGDSDKVTKTYKELWSSNYQDREVFRKKLLEEMADRYKGKVN